MPQGSTGSFGDLMNLKRFYDDSSIGSAENLVARAVPLSTVFCRQHHSSTGDSEESVMTAEVTGPYHHRSRIDVQQQQQLQQQQHQQQQQQSRRYACTELQGTGVVRLVRQHQYQYRTDMTSQQRIERMSRIMKQQNQRPEQMLMRFRHTMTLVSPQISALFSKYH